ncbi:AAA family ATPase [uncultured Eubacterium sp.]|mgnify:CR=1 FL=1|uniref:AAA family ATPase n=1 Tax=uncultured Eubacterium sp. TaxID=165185 RepID=UPI0025EC644B|nr:AAA family ATPase [uncultured Eubacterium sp.]MCI6538279.1 ATP-binding protein [Lachnospiraceae bacterium]
MKGLNIPVGVSDFVEIRQNGYYYVDKTGLICELLKTTGTKVTLITRPRRFGKTLTMSMLDNFFNIQKDSKSIFAGLEIAGQDALCREWMNRWPVIFVSFKQVDGLDFASAYEMLKQVVADVYKKHLYLLESEKIAEFDKQIIRRLVERKGSEAETKNSFGLLTNVMQAYYGQQVILLMDEYDVPVAKANSNGYYTEMLDMMKGIMQPLKDNPALRFAVITGCLKIAKESIFTGTNNFVSDTVTDSRLNEYFGFTQKEVDRILQDAGAEKQAELVKMWYDGYHFGEFDVYCPWDVMNYLRDWQYNPNVKPVGYWKNTSDNAIIRSFIDYAGSAITKKLEILLSGGYIVQQIDENLTYDYLHSSEDNLWSILYLTGYLTRIRETELDQKIPNGTEALIIPNAEIREIFETTIVKWFQESARVWDRQKLFAAVWNGDGETITQEMNRLLRKTISYHDYKEDFYHAFLAGIFAGAGCMVESNREHGEGRSDVVVSDPTEARVAVFEVKYSHKMDEMEHDCNAALQQIDERMYAVEYEDDYDQILCYGISFYKKRCLIRKK